MTTESQASGVMSYGESRRRQVGRDWPAEGGRQSPGGVGAGRPSPSEGGRQLPGRLRGRCGPPHCVCGCGSQHVGRQLRIEDLAAQEALCVLVQEGDVEVMLQGRSGEVGIPVKREVDWVPIPPRLLLRAPDAVRGRSGAPCCIKESSVCASHKLNRELWERVPLCGRQAASSGNATLPSKMSAPNPTNVIPKRPRCAGRLTSVHL